MPSNSSGFNLEENLVLSNEELTSNISKLTSFIRSYEGGTWEDARNKARKLLKDKTAFEYIDQVRATVAGTEKLKPEIKVPTPAKLEPINQQTIYEKNYDRLMAIAPGLEDKLENFNGEYMSGKAVKTGYQDFSLEVIGHGWRKFYVAIARHKKTESGSIVPDRYMEILIDTKKVTVEALRYKDDLKDIEVYTKTDNRTFTDKKEKRSQNDFLGNWLKEVRNNGQKIKWDEGETTAVPPAVPSTIPPAKKPDSPSSVIVDNYKKEEKEAEKVEEKKPETKVETKSEPVEKKEEAKIISLPKENVENRRESLRKFISIVAYQEIGIHVKNTDDLETRIQHILDHQGASDYLVNAWYKLEKESHIRLKELNFYRLTLLVPDVLDVLNNPGKKLRLVSEKSKEAFSIELGDNRKKNAKILAIYQLQEKEDIPTLLLKINEQTNSLSVDLAINGFISIKQFDADSETNTNIKPYQASIDVESWLKFLKENRFRAIAMDMQPEKDDNESSVSKVVENTEEPDDFDNDYINKDIPDFEPGQVRLTETHKKYGVTQEMIDEINSAKKGKVIFPRKQAMIHNTKDKKADLAQQAQKPGFRISKTGKFYFEGRSNRADRTRSGY